LSHLTAAQARAFSIADNRLTEQSKWDEELPGEIFAELAALDLDFSLEATGLTMAEIDLKIEDLTDSSEPDPADQIPESDGPVPVTQIGDLWLLDRHRILCGDALDRVSYATVMQGAPAHLVFTDPPYNVPIEGNVSGLGSTRHRDFAMASGEMSPGQFTHFLSCGHCHGNMTGSRSCELRASVKLRRWHCSIYSSRSRGTGAELILRRDDAES
jgi:hypothetical protein